MRVALKALAYTLLVLVLMIVVMVGGGIFFTHPLFPLVAAASVFTLGVIWAIARLRLERSRGGEPGRAVMEQPPPPGGLGF